MIIFDIQAFYISLYFSFTDPLLSDFFHCFKVLKIFTHLDQINMQKYIPLVIELTFQK